jgi:hypothetical protein
MIPGHTHAPAAPHSASPAPSPLAAMLQRHAMAAPPMQHAAGPAPQMPGAPLPLSAGGHPAGRAGHMPSMIPGA